MNKSVGIEPHWQDELQKHTPEINTQLSAALQSWPSFDEPFIVSRHVPPEYVATSAYAQEVLKPQGIVDIIQYFLIGTPTRFAHFAIARHERQGLITERDIEFGGLLLPHIRRAVTISDLLDVKTIERARISQALDVLRCAVVLTDGRGAVLYANRAAERMMREGLVIRNSKGALLAKRPSAANELSAAIALAAGDEAKMGKAGLAVRLTDDDDLPQFAHVLPLGRGELRTRLDPAAVAAVFIGAPPDERDSAGLVAAGFGLTPAETRVLENLLAGRTLKEAASELNIAYTTVRSHLDRILSKTGVSRQAELVRLAANIASPSEKNAPDR
jgi:DNA-binding CsgD family transcriptional regulator/PAS domain-containing protein